eukprot:m.6188 g.6188  ORF g.6188 m.6188 type:complete len:759 (-) comp5893_c0_seq1:67-2343(-)
MFFLGLFIASLLTTTSSLPTSATTVTATLDPSVLGRVFQGIGGVSASSSRRLYDYPEDTRSKLLDFLFIPVYGAALHHLKVEIGGDSDSTCVSEESHMHFAGDESYTRGYEFWLMAEAKKRNPDIILSGLVWTCPGFLGPFWSADQADYLVKWVQGAKAQWNVDIDYLGAGHNEQPYNTTFIKLLRQKLDDAELQHVRLMAADRFPNEGDAWTIASDMWHDPELMKAVDVISVHGAGQLHVPGSGPPDYVLNLTNKVIYESEEHFGDPDANLDRDHSLGMNINQNYLRNNMSATLAWPLVSGCGGCYPFLGFLMTSEPWAGESNSSYLILRGLWQAAHTTHFTTPTGWTYLGGSASAFISDTNASYVTFFNPKSQDITIVFESLMISKTHAPLTVSLQLVGSLKDKFANKNLNLWVSNFNGSVLFEKQSPGVAVDSSGRFQLSVEPGNQYTITSIDNDEAHVAPRQFTKTVLYDNSGKVINHIDGNGHKEVYASSSTSTAPEQRHQIDSPSPLSHWVPTNPFPNSWFDNFQTGYVNDSVPKYWESGSGAFSVVVDPYGSSDVALSASSSSSFSSSSSKTSSVASANYVLRQHVRQTPDPWSRDFRGVPSMSLGDMCVTWSNISTQFRLFVDNTTRPSPDQPCPSMKFTFRNTFAGNTNVVLYFNGSAVAQVSAQDGTKNVSVHTSTHDVAPLKSRVWYDIAVGTQGPLANVTTWLSVDGKKLIDAHDSFSQQGPAPAGQFSIGSSDFFAFQVDDIRVN